MLCLMYYGVYMHVCYSSGEQKKREEFYEERGEVDPSMYSDSLHDLYM